MTAIYDDPKRRLIYRFAARAIDETARKYPLRRMTPAQQDRAIEAMCMHGLSVGFADGLHGADDGVSGVQVLGELGFLKKLKKVVKKIKKPLAAAAGLAIGGAGLAYATGLIGGSKKKPAVVVGPVTPVENAGSSQDTGASAASILPTLVATAGQVAVARANAATQTGQFVPPFTSPEGQALLQAQVEQSYLPTISSGQPYGGAFSPPQYPQQFAPDPAGPAGSGIRQYFPYIAGGGALLLLVMMMNRRGG